MDTSTIMQALQTMPKGIAETNAVITQFDRCLLSGFAGGRQQEGLAALKRVFQGSPLHALLQESSAAIGQSAFQEHHFVALAAARSALQGAQYDALWQHIRVALGRPTSVADLCTPAAALEPLLDSARHWLMELAITGFARLDASAMLPFLPALAQIRQNPRLARLAFALTGWVEEILEAVPLARADDVPLLRWADLWSAALLAAVGYAPPAQPQPVTGTLFPLGAELRHSAQTISAAIYGVLHHADRAEFVRVTHSRFKVDAIRGEAVWLLLPKIEPLLNALAQGQALDLDAMPLLPTGDLLWDASKAGSGAPYKPLDVAMRFFAPQANAGALTKPLPPLYRHPAQLAEPLALTSYTVQDDALQLPDGALLPLDARWDAEGDLSRDVLASAASVWGLLRYDAERWAFTPLASATKKNKLAFVGQSGAKLFKKPPKVNAVAVLEERASRLLRK